MPKNLIGKRVLVEGVVVSVSGLWTEIDFGERPGIWSIKENLIAAIPRSAIKEVKEER